MTQCILPPVRQREKSTIIQLEMPHSGSPLNTGRLQLNLAAAIPSGAVLGNGIMD